MAFLRSCFSCWQLNENDTASLHCLCKSSTFIFQHFYLLCIYNILTLFLASLDLFNCFCANGYSFMEVETLCKWSLSISNIYIYSDQSIVQQIQSITLIEMFMNWLNDDKNASFHFPLRTINWLSICVNTVELIWIPIETNNHIDKIDF